MPSRTKYERSFLSIFRRWRFPVKNYRNNKEAAIEALSCTRCKGDKPFRKRNLAAEPDEAQRAAARTTYAYPRREERLFCGCMSGTFGVFLCVTGLIYYACVIFFLQRKPSSLFFLISIMARPAKNR